MKVEFLFGPHDGMEAEFRDDCYRVSFPCEEAAKVLYVWADKADHGGCYVYERDPGSSIFVYAGVS
jgi:hypothetical protein